MKRNYTSIDVNLNYTSIDVNPIGELYLPYCEPNRLGYYIDTTVNPIGKENDI